MDAQIIAWVGFNIFILAMLALDAYGFNRQPRVVQYKEALIWTVVWVVLALLFCLGIYFWQGYEPAMNFLAGYLIEKALSVDNLFVFLVIFTYFAVPKAYLRKVLLWGVLGALIMRAIFIFFGIVLIRNFNWMLYVFGIFVIITGIKLGFGSEKSYAPEKNLVIRLFRKFIPITNDFVRDRFIVKRDGRYWATPLLVVLISIETTDLIFALDSVPAILAITTDPFIVYTSNVFAILGLRALYFALSGFMEALEYLHYGLAALLIFIGFKMILADYIHIPIGISLAVIVIILAISTLASVIKRMKYEG